MSSCFRYFCKLQRPRIINHCEARWQSASIVAKKTNETTHPGKWPGDLVRYRLPTVTEMRYTGSLSRTVSHDLPWAGHGQIRPQRQTSGALYVFVPLREHKLISDLAEFCLTATEDIIILSERGIELCASERWYSLWWFTFNCKYKLQPFLRNKLACLLLLLRTSEDLGMIKGASLFEEWSIQHILG